MSRVEIIIVILVWSLVGVQAFRVLDDLNTTYRLEKRI